MKHIVSIAFVAVSAVVAGFGLLPVAAAEQATSQAQLPQWQDMFNGKDLTGWVNINTAEDTWKYRDGMLICSGRPIGVMCSEKQYENFVLHIEWMHMEAGGNSGVFVWSNARPAERDRLPNGVEVQMLELDWPRLNTRNGVTPPVAYVHGEVWGVGGVHTRQPARRAKHVDREPGQRQGGVEHLRRGRGRRDDQAGRQRQVRERHYPLDPEEGLLLPRIGRR
jgi:hypothetical protein